MGGVGSVCTELTVWEGKTMKTAVKHCVSSAYQIGTGGGVEGRRGLAPPPIRLPAAFASVSFGHKKSPFPGENSPSGKGRQLLFPLAKKGMTVYSLSSDKKAMTVILSTKSPPTIIMTRSKTRLSSP